jgi:VCBS repeat-containing protein
VTGTNYVLVDGLTYLLYGTDTYLKINGTYLPGKYSFIGSLTDIYGFSDDVQVDITFNDLPIADDKTVATDEDTDVAITLTTADLYPGSPTWSIVDEPSHGTLSGTAPDLTYTPSLNYNGQDSFTFKVNDGSNDSNIATVTINIAPINDAPIAVENTYSMDEDTTLSVAAPGVLANDTDVDSSTLTAVLDEDTVHGALTLNEDGSFTYTPNANFFGTDTFKYHAYDGTANSNIVTVTINIADVPETYIIYFMVVYK